MARRRIGQEDLIARPEARAASSLSELSALLDWAEIDRALVGISAAVRGEPGWPPPALFRGLLLATWHDLSDIRLAEALDDRASFRRFCGFAAHEPTPERTAFVRFRRELARRGLDRALFEAVTRQLEAKGVTVRAGTLVDATLIPSASIRGDGEARWAGHRRRRPVHGYKAHVATDAGAGPVRGVEVTAANVHDAAELEAVLPSEPGDVYADSAFTGRPAERVIIGRGGRPRTVWTGVWGRRPEALARLEAHNAAVRRVRCRIEKVFGTWKRSYGLRRLRWLGLAKAGLQVRLAAMAYNLRRTVTLVRAAAA
ncbi:MAG TPA: IS5 family transposase [Geminicoccaceae bacterium]|nr:IS5 family transposase [Geminicoccaceae bacterium]